MKGKRFLCAADNHGSHADPVAVKAFFEFQRTFKPEIRIHLGDCFDMACLRRGASDEEKREPLREDIAAGLDFLDKFKPHVFLRGNHDARLYDAVESDDGKLADFAGYLAGDIEDALKGAKVYPYDKRKGIHRVGCWALMHGYHAGLNAARFAAQCYGNSILGHVHASDQARAPRHDEAVGHTSGGLLVLEQKYNRGHANTLRQSQGWIYGHFFDNGEAQVHHADRMPGGGFFLPSEWRHVA